MAAERTECLKHRMVWRAAGLGEREREVLCVNRYSLHVAGLGDRSNDNT